MSAWIEVDVSEKESIGIGTDGCPEWLTTTEAKALALRILAAVEALK